MRHAALVGASDQIRMRLLAEAPANRSAELAAALARCLAGHGDVQVREGGTYWKIPEYLEFTIGLTATGSASACIASLRTLEPAGWSGDVWKHQPGGPSFLLPETRWVWLTTSQSSVERNPQSKVNTVAVAAATALLAVASYFALFLGGFAAALTSCDGADRHRAACTEAGRWWASTGFVYLLVGGLGVAVLGAWVWPRRHRWAWIGAGYLAAFAGFVINVAILRKVP